MGNYHRYVLVFVCMLTIMSTEVMAVDLSAFSNAMSDLSNAMREIIRYYQVNWFFFFFRFAHYLKN